MADPGGTRCLALILALVLTVTAMIPVPTPATGEEVQVVTPHVEWRRGLRSDPVNTTISPPSVTDLEGDGVAELVLTSEDSIYALRMDGSVRWRYSIGGHPVGAAVADLDGNGHMEVVSSSREGDLYCLNKEGAHLWSHDISSPVLHGPALSDLNGDDLPDVVVASSSGTVAAIDGLGNELWGVQLEGSYPVVPAIGETGRGQEPVIVLATEEGHIRALDGEGASLWEGNVDGAPAAPVVLADMDMTSPFETLVPGRDGVLYVVDGEGRTAGRWNATDALETMASPAALDLDHDGLPELVVPGPGENLTVLGAEGDLIWATTTHAPVTGISAVEAPDPGILYTTGDGELVLLDRDGLEVWSLGLNAVPTGSPVAGDMDGDGEMEVAVVTGGEEILLVQTHTVLERGWPTAGHDPANTRYLGNGPGGEMPMVPSMVIDTQDVTVSHLLVTDLVAGGGSEIGAQGTGPGNDGLLQLWDRTGSSMGKAHSVGPFSGPPLAMDLDLDGDQEVLTCNATGIQAWRDNLTIMWQYHLPSATAQVASPGNGSLGPLIIAGNASGGLVALDRTGDPLWSGNMGNRVLSLTLADLASDGALELAVSLDNGLVFLLRASDGAIRWSSDLLNGPPVPPVVADLDADGALDLALGSRGGDISAYAADGTSLWSRVLVDNITSLVAVGRGDADGPGNDLALLVEDVAGDSRLTVLDGPTGEPRTPIETGNITHLAAAHLGTDEPVVLVTTSSSGADLWTTGGEDVGGMVLRDTQGPAILGDLEGDGLSEVLLVNESAVTVFETDAGHGPTSPWSQPDHDAARTRNPFLVEGRLLPDLSLGGPDVVLDPPMVNGNGTVRVDVTVHNLGPGGSTETELRATDPEGQVAMVTVPALVSGSSTTVGFNWEVTYRNTTLTVEVDPADTLEELHEDNNDASRWLFINLPPLADAGEDRRVDLGEVVVLDGTSSGDPDGRITNYTWDLGDGNLLYGVVVTHTFNRSGTYRVLLNVTDDLGFRASDNATIHVNHRPVFMEWGPRYDPNINEGEDVEFFVLVNDPDGDPVELTWYLDGDEVARAPSWSWWANYSSSGDHEVEVTASDGNQTSRRSWDLEITDSNRLLEGWTPEGPVDLPQGQSRDFSIVLSPAAVGATTTWYLDGDVIRTGTVEMGLSADSGTGGTYVLKVEVSVVGSRDFHEWEVNIGAEEEIPRIRWVYPEEDTVRTEKGVPVLFGISAEGGGIQWTLDGEPLLGERGRAFTLDLWGKETYTVGVRVSSGTSSVSHEWTVEVLTRPLAVLEITPKVTGKGKEVTLDATASRARTAGTNITEYEWDLGDGGVSKGPITSHRYSRSGSYEVTLRVTDGNGLTSTVTATVVVKPEEREETPGMTGTLAVTAIMVALIAMGRRRSRP